MESEGGGGGAKAAARGGGGGIEAGRLFGSIAERARERVALVASQVFDKLCVFGEGNGEDRLRQECSILCGLNYGLFGTASH